MAVPRLRLLVPPVNRDVMGLVKCAERPPTRRLLSPARKMRDIMESLSFLKT